MIGESDQPVIGSSKIESFGPWHEDLFSEESCKEQ